MCASALALALLAGRAATDKAPPLPNVLPDPQGYYQWGSSGDRQSAAAPLQLDRGAALESCTGFSPLSFCEVAIYSLAGGAALPPSVPFTHSTLTRETR